MGVFDELKSRGLIAQVTNEKKVKDILNNQKINFYNQLLTAIKHIFLC